MALTPTIQNYPIPNFPKPLQTDKTANKGLTFPSDLLSDNRNYHTQIQFVEYKLAQQINSYGAYAMPSGGMKLPLPMKINDNQVLHWSSVSLTDSIIGLDKSGAAAGGVALAQLGGAAVNGGLALNPLMFMLFQRPEYRQFSLSWTLTPKNEKESETIKQIVTKCKQASLPDRSFYNLLMTYPLVALIKMHPDDIFGHMVFKPCIITSVLANYTAGPVPAFHKNGAPAVVSLTLNLQEMQFWFRKEVT